jgi:beta-N-acetylglucosaminidase
MHDRPRRLVAAGLTGLLLAATLAIPAAAASPHPTQVRKAEPRRVVEYSPNRPFTHDTDLLSQSGYAAWMIDELLLATTPLPRLGAAFTRAERETGINARYLVAHAILETGWGTSWIAQVKHNLFGQNAYDRDPLLYATRFPTFAAGIAAVSKEIRASYLSPDGPWWRGFPTLRGVNRFYASDVLWADKIAVLANAIDGLVITLRERGLHFGMPRVATAAHGAAVAASSSMVVEVPWTSRTLGLPSEVRFAVRWTPVALAEGGPTAPAGSSASTWTPVGRITHAGHSVRLSVATPKVPGSWRLEIEARDSDGWPLPVTDAPPIRPLALRVAAPTEATISVGLDLMPQFAEIGGSSSAAFAMTPVFRSHAGGFVATIRNVGRTTIPAVAQDGTPTLLEAWSLPLAADGDTVRLAGAPLLADLPPGGQVALHLPAPVGAAVVVLRLYGDPDAIGRSVPAIILFDSSESDRATLTLLHVPDLRDGNLLSPAPPAASAAIARPPAPPSPRAASVSVVQADAAREVAIGLVPVPASGRLHQPDQPQPSILMRTVSTLPTYAGGPTVAFVPWPGDRATNAPTTLCVAGVPTGIRLVIVALVPQGSSVADPATLRLAWAPVTASGTGATPR